MSRKVQISFALVISLLFLVGLFTPFGTWNDFDYQLLANNLTTYSTWEVPSYWILLALSAIILGFSFSPYIASRLLIIRITLVLFLPAIFLTFIYNFNVEAERGILGEVHIGLLLGYIGTLLTIVYGIIHFVSSYRTFKQMMKQQGMDETDLLDQ